LSRLSAPRRSDRLTNGAPVVTERQGDYLMAIAVRASEGMPPLVERELLRILGVSAVQGVHETLLSLRGKGLVTWERKRSRTLHLTALGEHFAALIGEIRSGAPMREAA
jgi:SOS-response transcriptional repressor LexA